eukprot:762719-Hanusia_phi.AAC.1
MSTCLSEKSLEGKKQEIGDWVDEFVSAQADDDDEEEEEEKEEEEEEEEEKEEEEEEESKNTSKSKGKGRAAGWGSHWFSEGLATFMGSPSGKRSD